ncbi:hypothetical protein MRB53_024883 [Persea americana]|uniref:Uncharacterized protein n=1 Tax=Persea americana TaxID=3435 RepID=A0ACC2LDN3_PERAE|nr:hypothetical protein MRB53_024883 [Persea americana]
MHLLSALSISFSNLISLSPKIKSQLLTCPPSLSIKSPNPTQSDRNLFRFDPPNKDAIFRFQAQIFSSPRTITDIQSLDLDEQGPNCNPTDTKGGYVHDIS